MWSPCGTQALFNVNADVSLTPFATYKKGVLSTNKETGKLQNELYLKWRKC